MKINVNSIINDDDAFEDLIKPLYYKADGKFNNNVLSYSEADFYHAYTDMVDRLNLIMPAKHQRGLIFKLTVDVLEDDRITDRSRAPWLTLKRGSKHWFIVNVSLARPAHDAIHPINLRVPKKFDKAAEDRYFSIIEKVTSTPWFNS